MGIEPSYDLEKMVDEPGFIEKIVVDGAKSQCYDEDMTGEFSQFEEKSVQLFFLLLLGRPGCRKSLILYYMVKSKL